MEVTRDTNLKNFILLNNPVAMTLAMNNERKKANKMIKDRWSYEDDLCVVFWCPKLWRKIFTIYDKETSRRPHIIHDGASIAIKNSIKSNQF